ncbi:ribonuclease HII [Arthrobacter sp. ISL-30]|uniref:ribonuclease HII n=1 Tax=Arthrobacter sp. ISL-30 TaxID=2819109 RepID=UPI001BE9A117|nr:ribonuclease HII [Arthrobacter sp. ISL-30]
MSDHPVPEAVVVDALTTPIQRGVRKATKAGAAKPGAAKPRKRTDPAPTLKVERGFLAPGVRLLAGVDEVGRGALAGPVSVGITVVDLEKPRRIAGVRDSKLLKPEDRERLEPLVRAWAVASAVGHATSREIDLLGLTAALRLAGTRAWEQVLDAGVVPDVVLLDGSHNWLSPNPQGSLFDETDLFDDSDVFDEAGALAGSELLVVPRASGTLEGAPENVEAPEMPAGIPCDAPVHTRVKADLSCLSVAAASVLAKVARDRMMKGFHIQYPGFGWDENKGYATPAHREALRALGPSPYHRISWNIL